MFHNNKVGVSGAEEAREDPRWRGDKLFSHGTASSPNYITTIELCLAQNNHKLTLFGPHLAPSGRGFIMQYNSRFR